jgi:hypothetical protein
MFGYNLIIHDVSHQKLLNGHSKFEELYRVYMFMFRGDTKRIGKNVLENICLTFLVLNK